MLCATRWSANSSELASASRLTRWSAASFWRAASMAARCDRPVVNATTPRRPAHIAASRTPCSHPVSGTYCTVTTTSDAVMSCAANRLPTAKPATITVGIMNSASGDAQAPVSITSTVCNACSLTSRKRTR